MVEQLPQSFLTNHLMFFLNLRHFLLLLEGKISTGHGDLPTSGYIYTWG